MGLGPSSPWSKSAEGESPEMTCRQRLAACQHGSSIACRFPQVRACESRPPVSNWMVPPRGIECLNIPLSSSVKWAEYCRLIISSSRVIYISDGSTAGV